MRNSFQFTWWKYIAAILIPIVLWCSVFESLAQPAKDQRLHILYVGSHLDSASLEQQITAALPSRTEQALRRIRVDAVSAAQTESFSILTARTFDYDILIFEESAMLPQMGQNVFANLSPGFLDALPDAPLYREDTEAGSLAFGFVLHQQGSTNPFSACYSGSQACYLFPSPQSENYDTLNGRGTAGHDAALQAVTFLLEMKP